MEQGILGMCNGEIRRLLIPADLGKQLDFLFDIIDWFWTMSEAYGQMGLPNLVPGTKLFNHTEAYLTISPNLGNTAVIYEVEML